MCVDRILVCASYLASRCFTLNLCSTDRGQAAAALGETDATLTLGETATTTETTTGDTAGSGGCKLLVCKDSDSRTLLGNQTRLLILA